MSVESSSNNSWKIPEISRKTLEIFVPFNQFIDRLELEAEFSEVHPMDLAGSYFGVGQSLLDLKDREILGLRNNIGKVERIDLMDDRFMPSKAKKITGFVPRELRIVVAEKDRDNYMHFANFNSIDLEELGGRIMNVGLLISAEIRIKCKRLVRKDGVHVSFSPFGVSHPHEKIKDRLEHARLTANTYDYSDWNNSDTPEIESIRNIFDS